MDRCVRPDDDVRRPAVASRPRYRCRAFGRYRFGPGVRWGVRHRSLSCGSMTWRAVADRPKRSGDRLRGDCGGTCETGHETRSPPRLRPRPTSCQGVTTMATTHAPTARPRPGTIRPDDVAPRTQGPLSESELGSSMPTGGPRTTCPWARSTCWPIPCSASRSRPEHVKPRLLGHWGTTPGLNFIYAHMNRVIRSWDLDAIYVMGPGHGGPATVANAYLEGTYSEVYPSITRDAEGMRKLFRQFSFPGGIPSHVAPETPGLDPRGRRARLRARARVRRRLRQPGPARLLRRRRRRGGDRATGHELALEQVPRPGPRRRRPADPPPERLQDRQPDGPRADPARRAGRAVRGLRLRPVLRRGRRPGADAPGDGPDDGPRHRGDRDASSATRARVARPADRPGR